MPRVTQSLFSITRCSTYDSLTHGCTTRADNITHGSITHGRKKNRGGVRARRKRGKSVWYQSTSRDEGITRVYTAPSDVEICSQQDHVNITPQSIKRRGSTETPHAAAHMFFRVHFGAFVVSVFSCAAIACSSCWVSWCRTVLSCSVSCQGVSCSMLSRVVRFHVLTSLV